MSLFTFIEIKAMLSLK